MIGTSGSGPRSPDAFYGWWMVGLASLAGALTGPGQSIGVSVFRESIAEELHTTDTAVSAAYLVGTLLASMTLPRIGRWVDEVGSRRAMTIVSVAFSLALAHMAIVGHVIWLAAGFLGIRMLGQGALALVAQVSVTHWFDTRRGLALGMTMTFTAAGMAVVPLLLSLGASAWGARSTWLVAAAIILVAVLAIARLGIVDQPEDLGQARDGGGGGGREISFQVDQGIGRSEVLRSASFWMLAAVASANSVLITGMVFHQTNVLGELGYSNTGAAAMFLPQAIGAIVGGLTFGWACDHRGRFLMPAAVAALLAAGCLLGGLGSSSGTVFAYSIVLGVCTGGGAAVNGTLLPALFGLRNIGTLTGFLKVISVMSTAIGPLAFSIGADVFGTYRGALVVFGIWPAVLVAAAVIWRPGRA